MRAVVPSVSLLAVAVAAVVSSCASSSSPGAAAASASVVVVSSPAAGSASTVHVSSPAAGSPQPSPRSLPRAPDSSAPASDGSPSAVPGPDDGKILTAADFGGMPFPFPGEWMTVSTAYLAVVDNSYLGIYTGVSPTDATQGVIVVASQAADAFKSPFAAPGMVTELGTGTLSILDVNGAEVTLKDAHGVRHTFNLQTHAFS
jgi:hypothetical protein